MISTAAPEEGRDPDLDFFANGSLGGGEPRAHGFTGTKALMLAVLEDGIATYLGGPNRLQAEAELWINSSARALFSFSVLCEILGLDPDAVRIEVRQWRSSARSRRIAGRSRPNVRRTPVLGHGDAQRA